MRGKGAGVLEFGLDHHMQVLLYASSKEMVYIMTILRCSCWEKEKAAERYFFGGDVHVHGLASWKRDGYSWDGIYLGDSGRPFSYQQQ